MNYFNEFVSASPAAYSTQTFFTPNDPAKAITSRAYAKIKFSGENTFSLLYQNVLDSTYSDGSHSKRNRIIAPYEIISAKIGVVDYVDYSTPTEPREFKVLTFDGKKTKKVGAGEFFHTDEITLNVKKGESICIELSFCGTEIPHHTECKMPVFVKENDKFIPSVYTPVPSMIGIKKNCVTRIAFWGDSITQGCGTEGSGPYQYYSAYISDNLSDKCAVWDIGIGYARGDDAATNGAWMYKAKHNDIVSIAFGVNDILHNNVTCDEFIKNVRFIIDELHKNGAKVILQTVPPFSFDDKTKVWQAINSILRNEIAGLADGFFDSVPILADSDNVTPKYGSHPNAEGHRIWAEALLEYIKVQFGVQ